MTWWVIQGELGFLGDPGKDLMDSRFSSPAYEWTTVEEAWHYATIERAIAVVRDLKSTKQFAGMDLYVCPYTT